MDLMKPFDTINHVILIKKLLHYGVKKKRRNLRWFKSYLNNCKQFITYNISCSVRQGSIHGLLLFLFYINDLPNASSVLDPIIDMENTNLFFSNNDIQALCSAVNMELEKISEWFKANTLSLNIKKTNYILFHKDCTKDDLPLKVTDLKFVNSLLKRKASIKFLGVMLDENVSWREHIKTVDNKLSKNIGLLCKTKQLLDNDLLKVYIYLIFNFI